MLDYCHTGCAHAIYHVLDSQNYRIVWVGMDLLKII